MFDLINGIPVHPLVVHAVVVLLPLAMLGTIAIAVRPCWRVTYGPIVVATAAVAAILCPVATSSGEALEKRVGEPGYDHAELGETLVWFAIALVLVSALLVLLQRRHDKATTTTATTTATVTAATSSDRLLTGVAVLAVLVALATTYQVYRVGDSGAKTVWKDQVSSTTGG